MRWRRGVTRLERMPEAGGMVGERKRDGRAKGAEAGGVMGRPRRAVGSKAGGGSSQAPRGIGRGVAVG
jgi:hypothetical protein